ncbi:MAG: glutaminase [Rhodospirillales bacterium]|nr:glutaminase [Rhodospirillales bacterium]
MTRWPGTSKIASFLTSATWSTPAFERESEASTSPDGSRIPRQYVIAFPRLSGFAPVHPSIDFGGGSCKSCRDHREGSRLTDLAGLVAAVREDIAPQIGTGRVADYIPALARVDPRHFGIAIATCDGGTAAAGDADLPFSIQSVSKVFTLTLALGRVGDALWRRVGREPSGSPFNSIVQLEREQGIPRNPLINAGALVVTDAILAGRRPEIAIAEILMYLRELADDPRVAVDREVAQSEAETGFRNASLANFIRSFGNIANPVASVLETYFNQCALAMTCRQLAHAGLFLANGGIDPVGGQRVVGPDEARRINAIMMTCGHYDASGDFAFRVGLPGKSGVGGGILAVAPRRASIAVWSPGLNASGNSLVGALALESLSRRTGWSVF